VLHDIPPSVERAVSRPGIELATAHRANVEESTGVDLSRVRVHADGAADASARDVRAHAYTVGHHIVFRAGRFAPETAVGHDLLTHELTHVAEQSRQPSTRPVLQRAIAPEDVAVEMGGEEFELAAPFTTSAWAFPKGARVYPTSWDNKSTTVPVWGWIAVASVPIPSFFDVPKTLLRPVRNGTSKVAPYSAGVASQAKVVEKNEAAVATATGTEKTRLEGLLVTRRRVLNQKLIQETMYNRFDKRIAAEVDTANKAHGLKGAAALDPNLVKAMLFEETELGTSGTHLEVPPSHPVKSRFNLGQVIDSSAMALLKMLETEQPAVMAKFALTRLRSDLAAAQTEKADLQKKKTLTAAEKTRLTELGVLSSQNWENFVWTYKAAGSAVGFKDAVDAFFASSSPAKNLDYDFWIHMAVLWLFEKKKSGMSWLEAIRAYNGTGTRADHYRDAISKRATDAAAAAASGKSFTPTR
jgi:hypothetical protein